MQPYNNDKHFKQDKIKFEIWLSENRPYINTVEMQKIQNAIGEACIKQLEEVITYTMQLQRNRLVLLEELLVQKEKALKKAELEKEHLIPVKSSPIFLDANQILENQLRTELAKLNEILASLEAQINELYEHIEYLTNKIHSTQIDTAQLFKQMYFDLQNEDSDTNIKFIYNDKEFNINMKNIWKSFEETIPNEVNNNIIYSEETFNIRQREIITSSIIQQLSSDPNLSASDVESFKSNPRALNNITNGLALKINNSILTHPDSVKAICQLRSLSQLGAELVSAQKNIQELKQNHMKTNALLQKPSSPASKETLLELVKQNISADKNIQKSRIEIDQSKQIADAVTSMKDILAAKLKQKLISPKKA